MASSSPPSSSSSSSSSSTRILLDRKIAAPLTAPDRSGFSLVKRVIGPGGHYDCMKGESVCVVAAEHMKKLLIGEVRTEQTETKPLQQARFKNDALARGKPLPASLQALLESKEPEHLVLHIAHSHDVGGYVQHAYVIEKINDTFRIYNSWIDKFTLGEWMGVDAWSKTSVDENRDDFFRNFGGDKIFKRDAVEKFMRYIASDADTGYSVTVNAYAFNDSLLVEADRLRGKIYTPLEAEANIKYKELENLIKEMEAKGFSKVSELLKASQSILVDRYQDSKVSSSEFRKDGFYKVIEVVTAMNLSIKQYQARYPTASDEEMFKALSAEWVKKGSAVYSKLNLNTGFGVRIFESKDIKTLRASIEEINRPSPPAPESSAPRP